MTRLHGSIPPDYFEKRYAAEPDPWQFETSDYERAKYEATLAALSRPRYASGFEIGCSIGVLTEKLMQRCDKLIAFDVAEAALKQARARCDGLGNAVFAIGQVPQDWPNEAFDLIMLSEVVYYLEENDVGRLAGRVRRSVAPDADVMLVHWTGETHYPLSGNAAAELFIKETSAFLTITAQTRTDAYRLDLLHVH